MSCPGMEDRLNDYAGGYLSGADREAVERHVTQCARCREELDALRSLLAEVASLPRTVQPPEDLWDDTLAAIRSRQAAGARVHRPAFGAPAWWSPMRLAAAAAILIVVSGAVTTLVVRNRPQGVEPAASAAGSIVPVSATVFTDIRAAEDQFEQATAVLLAALETRRTDLPPGTLAVIEENLRTVNEAIASARAALERDPGNARIGRVVTAMYRKRVDLLREAANLPKPI